MSAGLRSQILAGRVSHSRLSPRPHAFAYRLFLLRLDLGTSYQYWYGLPNFYVITRYNHSTHYAMAVWQLGLAVKDARGGY